MRTLVQKSLFFLPMLAMAMLTFSISQTHAAQLSDPTTITSYNPAPNSRYRINTDNVPFNQTTTYTITGSGYIYLGSQYNTGLVYHPRLGPTTVDNWTQHYSGSGTATDYGWLYAPKSSNGETTGTKTSTIIFGQSPDQVNWYAYTSVQSTWNLVC